MWLLAAAFVEFGIDEETIPEALENMKNQTFDAVEEAEADRIAQ